MIGGLSRISGAFSNSSIVSLFQSATVSQSSDAGTFQATAGVAGTFRGPSAQAIDSIIQIVMNANGDTATSIDTDAAVTNASTGSGNDNIDIQAARAYAVTSGAGDDTLSITVSGSNTSGRSRHHGQDHGNSHLPTVMGVGAGDGNDTINIDAKGVVMAVSGEAGNDTVNVKTNALAFGVYGGDGNDNVNVDAKLAVGIDGGAGNDVVNVKASSIFGVSGGTGNDVINIDNTGKEQAQVFFSQGDGQDVINSNGAVSINLFTADGTRKLDMSAASWTQDGNSVKISFGGTSDSITVNLTGDAAAGNASVSYDDQTGNLVIGPGKADGQSQASGSVSITSSLVVSA
jgi:hypothetical protein